ncbi:histone deacetylase [Paucihalobacter ruber]|uniref:Histone deacetylase n=1 Tax=Paucihalobacter ruber TaxID=2567861 RepID=A0A506PML0_9FLAO|nr:histone deacetylase [Paucihalobacter ruber]TPV34768.1 histone deacetylase [Paucihalobacter ruber]
MLKIAHRNIYTHPLPEGHRFPMLKYELLPEQLLYEGTCNQANFFEPENAEEAHIAAVHTTAYISSLKQLTLDKKAIRKIGFPLSKELVNREEIITDGSIKASDFALQFGVAMNVAGGTHHAYTNRGEAFCLYNDQAIAARYLQRHRQINKILIVDLDVHQGNGTAQIFQNDPSVFTFSMHGASNYPFHKEQSDLDIALPNGTNDTKYLSTLKNTIPRLIDDVQPDFIFYLCGVDILESDKLGKLACSLKGCAERDRYVLQTCKDLNIPVMCSMGGGYSPEIKTIVEAHANTFRIAQEIFF